MLSVNKAIVKQSGTIDKWFTFIGNNHFNADLVQQYQGHYVACQFFLSGSRFKYTLFASKYNAILCINPKRAGGGGQNPPPSTFLLHLCQLLFFRAETSWLFFFKHCAWFKTILIKIGPRVMTRLCVIARWVQRKTDFPLKLHTNRVFCLFVFQDTLPLFLSYSFGLFGVRTCVSKLWHTSLLKNATFAWKK